MGLSSNYAVPASAVAQEVGDQQPFVPGGPWRQPRSILTPTLFRISAEVQQSAVVLAVVAWQAAMRDERIPRRAALTPSR